MCFSIFFCYQYVVMTNQSFVVNLWLDIIKLGYSYLGRIDNSAYKVPQPVIPGKLGRESPFPLQKKYHVKTPPILCQSKRVHELKDSKLNARMVLTVQDLNILSIFHFFCYIKLVLVVISINYTFKSS